MPRKIVGLYPWAVTFSQLTSKNSGYLGFQYGKPWCFVQECRRSELKSLKFFLQKEVVFIMFLKNNRLEENLFPESFHSFQNPIVKKELNRGKLP